MAADNPNNTLYTDYIPGNRHKINPAQSSWLRFTFTSVHDNEPLHDAYNRWGSPYTGGSLMGMADGSVRTVPHGVSHTSLIPMLTPQGGDISDLN